MRVVGLIPARGGSKGLPRKNILPLHGKPLIAHSIEHALKAQSIDRVLVSTDCEEIAQVARSYGAEVPFLRPSELAGDTTPDFPVIEHAYQWLCQNQSWDADLLVFLRPTNIFRTPAFIDACVNKAKNSNCDSVRAISPAVYPPYWMKRLEGDYLVPLLDADLAERRRQDLPAVYQGNGTIEVIKRETIMRLKTRFGSRVGYFEMPAMATIDIDTSLDFRIAEILYPEWLQLNV